MASTEGLVSLLALLYFSRRRVRTQFSAVPAPSSGGLMSAWSLLELSKSSLATFVPLVYILTSRRLRVSSPNRLTPLLADTYNDRDKQLMFYFLKGALWTNYTRPKVQRLLNWAEGSRVFGLVAGLFGDHVRLVDELYYCESSEQYLIAGHCFD